MPLSRFIGAVAPAVRRELASSWLVAVCFVVAAVSAPTLLEAETPSPAATEARVGRTLIRTVAAGDQRQLPLGYDNGEDEMWTHIVTPQPGS